MPAGRRRPLQRKRTRVSKRILRQQQATAKKIEEEEEEEEKFGSEKEEKQKQKKQKQQKQQPPRKKHKAMYSSKERAGANPCVHHPPRKSPESSVYEDEREPLPKRNKHGELVFKDAPDFRPNLTPKEVLQAGAFGGTYFRTIHSSVTGETHKGNEVIAEFPQDWFEGLDKKAELCSPIYDPAVNRYGVRCGGGLDMWETSGWISKQDPYGWFQWYCRFYLGRRSSDDERQLKRGMGVIGPKGRWRNNLIAKCARQGKPFDDYTVSPVVRQALLHWGYHLTERDANAYVKKKNLPLLPPPLGTPLDSRHEPKKEQPFFNPNTMQKMAKKKI